MDELDGNRAAGLMRDIFGAEMTVAVATCAGCATAAPLGECGLYMTDIGTVMRCRTCDRVLAVVTRIRAISCVDTMGISALEMPRVA